MEIKQIAPTILSALKKAVDEKAYVRLQYFNRLHEFYTKMTVLKNYHEGNSVENNEGEKIDLENIVRINEVVAPQHQHLIDFSCDC